MQVQQVGQGDGAVLQEIRLLALRDAPQAFAKTYEQESQRDVSYWQDQAARQSCSDDSTTFFLIHQGQVYGMIGAYFDNGDRHRAYLCSMWVAPIHRRSGAGARLVDTAARWLAERGAPQILAWVADSNTAAIRFYENLGFLTTGARDNMPGRPEQTEILLALDAGMVRQYEGQRAA